jgi:hypothetical protein
VPAEEVVPAPEEQQTTEDEDVPVDHPGEVGRREVGEK